MVSLVFIIEGQNQVVFLRVTKPINFWKWRHILQSSGWFFGGSNGRSEPNRVLSERTNVLFRVAQYFT